MRHLWLETICPSCDCGNFGQTAINRQRREIERLEGGIRRIGDFLNEEPPRVGDASWTVEALLAR
jgi:hypothetical protein